MRPLYQSLSVEEPAQLGAEREETEDATRVDETHALAELPRGARELRYEPLERLGRVDRIKDDPLRARQLGDDRERVLADASAPRPLIAVEHRDVRGRGDAEVVAPRGLLHDATHVPSDLGRAPRHRNHRWRSPN